MSNSWKYWDNDFREWKTVEPDYLDTIFDDEITTNSVCGLTTSDIERIQSHRTQAKLPNLTIYDLLEDGFKNEPEKEPYISSVRQIKSQPDHYTHYTQKTSDGLRCTSQDMPRIPGGPRFGLLDDAKLARRVGNKFPINGFYKLASHMGSHPIDSLTWNIGTETENIIPVVDKPEKERKIAKHNLNVNFEPTVYHDPNPISHRQRHEKTRKMIGYHHRPISQSNKARVPSQLSSRRCELQELPKQFKYMPSALVDKFLQESIAKGLINEGETEMIKFKIKNLNELTKGYANKNSNLLLCGGQQSETQAYRMDINDYRKMVEKGNDNEPMTCRKILPEQNVSGLSNINIDFESALASRKNAKNTYRKYSNVKRWEANLRAYQGLSSAPQTSRRHKAAQRFEDSDWLDGPAADVENSKNMSRPLPPPPSPTVKSLATLPH